ncbi:pyridoxamine 5'-phosphate oxidase family protein [Pseudoalteromonas sp. OOF1S-7]|uniref:pyridoxamine 5'-phosphate oxidase family protein n=1 Tax=Pseudoalteromonas sp. OOF1S-7 TaxID=2917757 RepID=UPI001EF72BA8|nr:pyridoxamine 5'-phosphate oxidase family protein [Pseudoalteromonas sp. OOF1S-7]MCG7534600.1 pyridoxamine 5'-phosphate oxidase family protein [Pseudoalteromonas sp. OOF1S-7]
MSSQPKLSRIGVPFDMKPEDEGVLLPWSRASEQLNESVIYWVCTSRKDGRPLAVPVWGVWKDETFYMRMNPYTRTRTNLDENPNVVVHLESGEDAVIFESVAEKITDEELRTKVAEAFDEKYDFPQPSAVFYQAKPITAMCQLCHGVGETAANEYRASGTKYRWESGEDRT